MTIDRLQKRIYLGILAMFLLPVIGGIVQWVQISGPTWQVPFWSVPHQPGSFFWDNPDQLRMMILVTFLTTVALTLAAGFYLVHAVRALGRNESLSAEGRPFPEGKADTGESRPKKPGDGHPAVSPLPRRCPRKSG